MSLSSDKLIGKVCVVTGAAKSIGFAIAEKFARQGAVVVMLDISEEIIESAKKLTDQGLQATGFIHDVTNRQATLDLFGDITNKFGPVYVLVNNAGVVDQRPFEDNTEEIYDRMFRVNVYGTSWCIQGALPGMKSAGGGKIINFSSKSGKTGSALMEPYSAAKGAIIALTHALAFEYAEDHINVNCVCPGITDMTGVWSNVSKSYTENLQMDPAKVVEKFSAKIPLKRLTSIEDVVEYVFFLAAAGDYCTGQALNISGGREVH